jgi:hypothetical protein
MTVRLLFPGVICTNSRDTFFAIVGGKELHGHERTIKKVPVTGYGVGHDLPVR